MNCPTFLTFKNYAVFFYVEKSLFNESYRCMVGLIVGVLATSAVDCVIEPRFGQTKGL